ncbi:hypothetical protein G6F31_021722 [Rhizopus arrhizus]|nr:hypothetical protein G6F31_021722 [Rhizopus arrhizus]
MTAGPAWVAAAGPVSTKIPAPITAPTPSRMRCLAVRVRFNVASPSRLPSMGSPASTCPAGWTGLTLNRAFSMQYFLVIGLGGPPIRCRQPWNGEGRANGPLYLSQS